MAKNTNTPAPEPEEELVKSDEDIAKDAAPKGYSLVSHLRTGDILNATYKDGAERVIVLNIN